MSKVSTARSEMFAIKDSYIICPKDTTIKQRPLTDDEMAIILSVYEEFLKQKGE